MDFEVYIRGEKQNAIVSGSSKEAALDFLLKSAEESRKTFPGRPIPDRNEVVLVQYVYEGESAHSVQ